MISLFYQWNKVAISFIQPIVIAIDNPEIL